MPETTKLDGRDEVSSKTQEPIPGVKDEAGQQPVATAPAEVEAGSQPLEEVSESVEAARALPPEAAEEASIRELAESVVSGLEQAGIKIDESIPLAQTADAVELPDNAEGFFAGWDGLADEHLGGGEQELPDEHEAEDPAQPFEEFSGQRTLSEMSLASAALAAADDAGNSAGDVSSKHDELADAVQSALVSIYGDPSSANAGSGDLAFSPGAGWATPHAASPDEDRLSPQDVILNYFSYEPNAQKGSPNSAGSLNGAAAHNGDARDGFGQTQWSNHPAAQRAAYDGPPSYPVPAGFTAPAAKSAAASERESSRLLGAAAIGLVGGIAIAASLAVFVINSYGPGIRNGPNRALDATDAGYGRGLRIDRESEAVKSATAAPSAEDAGTIAAADIVATPGQPSALAIGIKPDRSLEQTLISITGVPEGARLNAGVDAGGGNWLLPPRRLNGLTINLPATAAETVVLGVQLLDSNVRTPLTDKKEFAIRVSSAKPEPSTFITVPEGSSPNRVALPETPKAAQAAPAPAPAPAPLFSTQTVSTPPVVRPAVAEPQTQAADLNFRTQPAAPPPSPQQASAAPLQALLAPKTLSAQSPGGSQEVALRKGGSQTEIEDLIREGNKRMREGDILEARQLYQKAVALGDPEAALAMGRSYDPIYFARIDKKNAEPDAAKAFDWYRKAMDGGAAQTAKVRIENLKHFLNE